MLGPPAHPQVDHCHIEFDEAELLDNADTLQVWDGGDIPEPPKRPKAPKVKPAPALPLPAPIPGRSAFTPGYWATREAIEATQREGEFYEGELRDLNDALDAERELSDIARRRGLSPGEMIASDWANLADDLLEDAGDALELATQAGREAAGRKAVGRKRIQGRGRILQIGGKDVEQQWTGGSAKAAAREAVRINRETKSQAQDFMTEALVELGYKRADVDGLGYIQKRKLLSEVGHGVPLKGNIGKVKREERERIIREATPKQQLGANAIALNPRAGEGIEVFGEYELAMVKAGREKEIVPFPDVNEQDIPNFVRFAGGLKPERKKFSFEIEEDTSPIDF